jgi:hypothetical protein
MAVNDQFMAIHLIQALLTLSFQLTFSGLSIQGPDRINRSVKEVL